MDLQNPIFYCQNCKKITTDLESLLFVEEKSPRGFCSEKCIEQNYQHLVNYFEQWEKDWRKKNNLQQENIQLLADQTYFTDQILRGPNEIWKIENILQEKMYSFIKYFNHKNDSFSACLICFIFDKQPSFILASTASRENRLINKFRIGERQENFELKKVNELEKKILDIDEFTLATVENKKSIYIADMLEERNPKDIPFESFHLYDSYFENTMQNPDEIYLNEDSEGDQVKTYIKAYEREGVSFYYFVICMEHSQNNAPKNSLIPILSFPTLDSKTYYRYRKGQQIAGNLKS